MFGFHASTTKRLLRAARYNFDNEMLMALLLENISLHPSIDPLSRALP